MKYRYGWALEKWSYFGLAQKPKMSDFGHCINCGLWRKLTRFGLCLKCVGKPMNLKKGKRVIKSFAGSFK